jgi:uncharacterized protein
MTTALKVAIIGSGIAGLSVAHSLVGHAEVSLFESGSHFGGHTHTVDITLPTPQGLVTHGIDTGFLVYNERTYPNLIALFAQLDVETVKSEMSFSVQVPGALEFVQCVCPAQQFVEPTLYQHAVADAAL